MGNALGAGLVLFKIYTRWAHGFPWYHADYWGIVGIELVGALLLWGCLGVLAVLGVRRILMSEERSEREPERGASSVPQAT